MTDAMFTCNCGAAVAVPTDGDVPALCPQCHELFFVPSAKRPTPIVKSIVARIGAWGCLMPVGVLFTLIGLHGLLAGHATRPLWTIAAAQACLGAFVWLVWVNSRSLGHFFWMVAPVCAVIATVSGYLLKESQAQRALDTRFAAVLADARAAGHPKIDDASVRTVLSPKYLPVVLTERGALQTGDTPHVESEFFAALSPESRPDQSADVHTIVMIDWTYEQTGVYVSKDQFKTPSVRVYAGGCTVSVFDRDSKKCICGKHFVVQTQAPATRESDTITTWYGPQPLEADIDAYVKTLKFAGK